MGQPTSRPVHTNPGEPLTKIKNNQPAKRLTDPDIRKTSFLFIGSDCEKNFGFIVAISHEQQMTLLVFAKNQPC